MTQAILKSRELSFNDQAFQRDGKSFFLLSGEMHYFRVDADCWPKHLELIKKAGLSTVSSYVPWSLHEQIDGRADFEGGYEPNLNLVRFIELCRQMELNLTLKPGPYILAELVMHGIPRWFFENYPEALACDSKGKPCTAVFTCLAHPAYRQKVLQWYDTIMPLIAANQSSSGGPIAMLQVCNEVGLFQWLTGAGDYSPASLQAYRSYLQNIYQTVAVVNQRYGTDYPDFDQIYAPAGKVTSKADHLAYQDWENFHREFYADYIGWLIEEIRQRKVTVPLFHNVPGWVYGRARHMPVCLSMYHKLARLYPDIMLGVDHIPENPSYRNFHDDRMINAFTKALQSNRGPIYIAELQAGTREANVRVYPGEMELFYKACLANGAVGMNYYMFSQGCNPPGWGVYDSSFYLQTPLDVDGKIGEHYHVIHRTNELIKTHGQRLCQCTAKTTQALAFYPPYYYRELKSQIFTGENLDDPSRIQCRLDPRLVTDELLFDGVGKLLAMDNQEYDAVDITAADATQLGRFRQIWTGFTEQMDKDDQQKLLHYVRGGGHLICFPTLPKLDLNCNPCTILAEGLGITTDEILDDPCGMIQWTDSGEQIHALTYIETFSAESADIIASASNGKPCGIKVRCGKGSAAVFGTGFIYQAAAHKQAWQRLSLPRNFRGAALCDNPLIITRTRLHPDGGGYFFLLNYHNQPMTGRVTLKDQVLPTDSGQFYLPPSSGLMLPFDFPLSDSCTLIHTTSEISDIQPRDTHIALKVTGHEKTPGQMILNTSRSINNAALNGKSALLKQSANHTVVYYAHTGMPDSLTIAFSK